MGSTVVEEHNNSSSSNNFVNSNSNQGEDVMRFESCRLSSFAGKWPADAKVSSDQSKPCQGQYLVVQVAMTMTHVVHIKNIARSQMKCIYFRSRLGRSRRAGFTTRAPTPTRSRARGAAAASATGTTETRLDTSPLTLFPFH